MTTTCQERFAMLEKQGVIPAANRAELWAAAQNVFATGDAAVYTDDQWASKLSPVVPEHCVSCLIGLHFGSPHLLKCVGHRPKAFEKSFSLELTERNIPICLRGEEAAFMVSKKSGRVLAFCDECMEYACIGQQQHHLPAELDCWLCSEQQDRDDCRMLQSTMRYGSFVFCRTCYATMTGTAPADTYQPPIPRTVAGILQRLQQLQ